MAARREIRQHKCLCHNMKLKDRGNRSNTNRTRNVPVASMDLPRVSRAPISGHGVRYDQLLSKIERSPGMFLGFDEGLRLRDKFRERVFLKRSTPSVWGAETTF